MCTIVSLSSDGETEPYEVGVLGEAQSVDEEGKGLGPWPSAFFF